MTHCFCMCPCNGMLLALQQPWAACSSVQSGFSRLNPFVSPSAHPSCCPVFYLLVTHATDLLAQVAVAQQIYDYVDQRIRRLDKDLKAFDAELTKDRVRQGLPVCSSLFTAPKRCFRSKLSDLNQTCICTGAGCTTPVPELAALTPSHLHPYLLPCPAPNLLFCSYMFE